MSENTDNLILGGGIAGLSAQHELCMNGRDSLILEAQTELGGLLRSFEVSGFTFDQAVHLSFACEPEVREIFDRVPYWTHKPESLNWDGDRWLRHPVQNNLYPLPTDVKVEQIASIAQALEKNHGPLNNYYDWLVAQYGKVFAERYPLRYTRKYWRTEAETLGIDWIGGRMRHPDLREVLRGALSHDQSNTYYVSEMRYPKSGGYFSFIRGLADAAHARCCSRVVSISLTDKKVYTADGCSVNFNNLISTISLPELILSIEESPTELRAVAQTLSATSIDLISIGFNRPDIPPSLWFYIYDEWIEAARAYSPSWKSSENAPEGCSSLQFEIYSGANESRSRKPEYLIENTILALSKMGLADRNDILFTDHRTVRDGNVVFFKGMEKDRDRCLSWLSKQKIESAGRFGEWAYLWSNQAFMSGKRAARRVLDRDCLSRSSSSAQY